MAIQEAVVPPPLSIVEDNTEQRGGRDSSRSPVPGRSKGDYILGASTAMCTALEKVGSIAPVPFLKEAAGVAGNLLQMIIDKNLNEGAFRSLLHEICDLIMVLQSECDAAKTITDEFKASVEEVLEQLTALEKLCLEYDDKNMLDKLLFHNLHKEDIEERRRRVEQIFRRFNLVNSITIRRRVDELVEAYNKRSVDLMPNADAGNLPVQSSPPGTANQIAIAAAGGVSGAEGAISDRSFQNIQMLDVDEIRLTTHSNNAPSYYENSGARLVDESFKGAVFKGSKAITITSHSQNGNVNAYNTINDSPIAFEAVGVVKTRKGRWWRRK